MMNKEIGSHDAGSAQVRAIEKNSVAPFTCFIQNAHWTKKRVRVKRNFAQTNITGMPHPIGADAVTNYCLHSCTAHVSPSAHSLISARARAGL